MSSQIQHFKSFEEASQAYVEACVRKGFDYQKSQRFLKDNSKPVPKSLKPGLYRFKNFEEAQDFDLKHQALSSIL